MNARILCIVAGVAGALALSLARCEHVHVPYAAAAPTGVTGSSGPTGLTSLPPGVPVAPGAILSGSPLRIGEAIANTADPTTGAGVQRPVGAFLYTRNGQEAWVKTGTAATAWSEVVNLAPVLSVASDRILGRDAPGTGPVEQLTVGGGLGFTGAGGVEIAANGVTLGQLQQITTDRLLGRDTAATGNVEQLTVGNGLEFTGGPGIGVANDGVTNARLANMANATIKCRTTAGTGDPEDCTGAQAGAIIGAVGGGAFALVSSQDVSASPVTWSGLTGDAADTLGYQIHARLKAGATSTIVLRLNNQSGNSDYMWTQTNNSSAAVTAATDTADNEIELHTGSLSANDILDLSIFIPVSGNSGTGFNVTYKRLWWHATYGSAVSTVATTNGGGALLFTAAQITRIDLLTTAGSLAAGSRAALYRVLR